MPVYHGHSTCCQSNNWLHVPYLRELYKYKLLALILDETTYVDGGNILRIYNEKWMTHNCRLVENPSTLMKQNNLSIKTDNTKV